MKDIYPRLRQEKDIVAFCGKKRSGKDTAAEAIESLGYRPIAFADPIKETCRAVFQFDDDQIDGSKKSERDEFWKFSPRWAMQMVGTDLFRDGIDEDVWVKSLLRRIDGSNHDKFAVTDVRFPNEVRHLMKAGARMVYIERPETEPELHPVKKKIATFAARGSSSWKAVKQVAELFTDFGSEYHPSEISLDDHPVSQSPDVINDSSIEDFKTAVRYFIRQTKSADSDFIDDFQVRGSSVKSV